MKKTLSLNVSTPPLPFPATPGTVGCLQHCKDNDGYKMIIPLEVEEKIRYMCQQSWNTEWSGVLFYQYEGSFEEHNLTITCKDFYVMDIGSATYTEFRCTSDVAHYMALHPELIDYQMGLIHSHNNLDTFFSGTDTNTLLEEGTDRNNFVSLIVNNAGDYKAAITRKAQHTKNINDNTSYSFFSEQTKRDVTSTYQVVEDCVEYYLLAIDRQLPLSWQELKERVADIQNKKKREQKNIPFFGADDLDINEGTLFSSKINCYNTMAESTYSLYDYLNLKNERISSSDIQEVLLQLISCNPLLTTKSKFDINSWIGKMDAVFSARFTGKAGNEPWYFDDWVVDYVEYIISNKALELSDKIDANLDEIEEELVSRVIKRLRSFKKKSKFISSYIDALKLSKEIYNE